MKKCRTKYCRHKVTPANKSPYCSKCKMRKWKLQNPLKYHFLALRNNSKRRGIECLLTFEQYRDWAILTGYDKGRGTKAYSLTIDRIDATKGYTIDNIRPLTKSENSKRVWKDITLST